MGIIHSLRSRHEDTSSKRIDGPNSSKRIQRLMKEEEKDFISNLPEDIIVSILSLLDTIEQQAITSVLARRWRYLWTFSTTTNLVFWLKHGDPCSEFVCRVNQVIKATMASSTNIGTFNLVLSSWDKTSTISQYVLDEWLNLALQKRVKRLRLQVDSEHNEAYSLNNSSVMSGVRNQSLVLDSLTSLHLCYVDVSGEVLEYILYSASPFLEELSIRYPGPSLVKFTVSGWFLKLKHLEFEFCYKHKGHLNIHDVNLESLRYTEHGRGMCLTMRDTPRVVKACLSFFSSSRYDTDMNFGNQILSNLSQLQTLAINFYTDKELNQFLEFPKVRNLKKLKIAVGSNIFCICSCALLLDAFPLLSEFKLEYQYLRDRDEEDKVSWDIIHFSSSFAQFNCLKEFDKEGRLSRLKYPHKGLKVVEIVGFIGCQLDLGVSMYLIKNIASLEMMIVDSYQYPYFGKVDPWKRQAARALARIYLKPRLSSQTKMIVS